MTASSTKNTESFSLLGMHCVGCANRAGEALRALPGVDEAEANFTLSEITVTYDTSCVNYYDLASVAEQAGFRLIIPDKNSKEDTLEQELQAEARERLHQMLVAIVLSIPIMVLGILWMDASWASWTIAILTSIILLYSGRDFFTRAYRQIRGGGLGMDTLVALSTSISYIFSIINLVFPHIMISLGEKPHLYFEASAMIIAFVLVGKSLESSAKRRAAHAIRSLMRLRPKEATVVLDSGLETKVNLEQILPGAVVRVAPGEQIPVDGIIIRGNTHTDESILTGESSAVPRQEGASVYSGSINIDGLIDIRSEVAYEDTKLSRMIALVKKAITSKAPIQRFADKVSGYFVATILILALLVFFTWIFLGSLSSAFVASITVLVVSCPCALGIATPMALSIGINQAARRGILIRDAEALEFAHTLNGIVFDKTGTITEGKPKVTSQLWLTPSKELLLPIIYQMERHSKHPLSQAIADALPSSNATIDIANWKYLPGLGISAYHSGKEYLSGNQELMNLFDVTLPIEIQQTAILWEERGESLVYIAESKKCIALLGVTDTLRSGSLEAINQLHCLGLKTYMLSGDRDQIVQRIGISIGIDEVKGKMLPEEKARYIETLQKKGIEVAMVGDGINDSASLATAKLGIAMGSGSDIAIDSASITITSNNLMQLPELINLSKATMSTVKQNLFWAFSYNIIAIPLATGFLSSFIGWSMTPMLASLMMTLSSIIVVLNSLKLMYQLSLSK